MDPIDIIQNDKSLRTILLVNELESECMCVRVYVWSDTNASTARTARLSFENYESVQWIFPAESKLQIWCKCHL